MSPLPPGLLYQSPDAAGAIENLSDGEKGILFVTHSIEEALTVGTQIVVLEDGICKKSYDLREAPFPMGFAV